MRWKNGLGALVLGVIMGTTGAGATSWTSPENREHPLVGTVWQVDPGRRITPKALAAALAPVPLVVLGERHDNGDHHRLQAELITALGAAGRQPMVALEMLDQDQQAAAARAARTGDPDTVAAAVDWAASGWPDFALYRPVVAAALRHGRALAAANVPRDQLRTLAREGFDTLPAARRAQLGLDHPLPEAQAEALHALLESNHCMALPSAALTAMGRAQRLRDATMADTLRATATGDDGAVLITGNEHARTDRGVPWVLRETLPGPTPAVVSVGLVEVAEGVTDPTAYAEAFGSDTLPYDYVWFTPGEPPVDPCEAMRKAGHTPTGDQNKQAP